MGLNSTKLYEVEVKVLVKAPDRYLGSSEKFVQAVVEDMAGLEADGKDGQLVIVEARVQEGRTTPHFDDTVQTTPSTDDEDPEETTLH